eukprot:3608508-Pyramimonas_sp.AAC.1
MAARLKGGRIHKQVRPKVGAQQTRRVLYGVVCPVPCVSPCAHVPDVLVYIPQLMPYDLGHDAHAAPIHALMHMH